MKNYKYVLIDMDGTIADSALGIENCFQYALNKMGIFDFDLSLLRSCIGPPIRDSFMKFFKLSKADTEKAVFFYRERYSTIGVKESTIYNGVENVLNKLVERGKVLAVATGKPEPFALSILNNYSLKKYFSFIGGSTPDYGRNTKPQVIKYTLDNLGVTNYDTAIMIGDRHHDIDGANLVGIDSIGVLYGYGNRDELEKAKATYICEKPNDILSIIL